MFRESGSVQERGEEGEFMRIHELNRFKELYCVIFGHEFGEHYYEREAPDGFVLEHRATCINCRISIIDISGRMRRYAEEQTRKGAV